MAPFTVIIAWILAGLLAVVSGVGIWRAVFRDRSRGRRRCPKCWYDMTSLSSLTCPECGKTAKNEHSLRRTRRRYVRACACFLLLLVAASLPIAERTRRLGWAGLPSKALFAAAPFAYPAPRAQSFDASFYLAVRDRLAGGVSSFDTALLDRGMALAILTGTNKPQAIADTQSLFSDANLDLPRCIDAMRRLAQDPDADANARFAAIQSLSMVTMSRADMLDFWRWALRHPDFGPNVRATAAAAIGHMEEGGLPALDDLVAALDDPDRSVVHQAISALGRFRGGAGPVLPRLLARLPSPDGIETSRVLNTISSMGAEARAAVPRLCEIAGDPSMKGRAASIEALGWIGPAAEPSVDTLLAVAKSPSVPTLRAAAVISLAHILGPLPDHPRHIEATQMMVDSLANQSMLIRMETVQAIFLFGWNPGTRGPEMRQLGDSLKGRAAIWGRLLEARAVGTLPQMEDELIALLRPGVDPALSEEQEAAMEALGYLRCERAVDVLSEFCDDIRQSLTSADSQLRYFDARRAIHRIKTGVRLR